MGMFMHEVCYVFMLRHTKKMIEKFESAGLGFYVKATEMQQKLGEFRMVFHRFAYYLLFFSFQARYHYVSWSTECWSYLPACVHWCMTLVNSPVTQNMTTLNR